jgi:hypothetical protein
MLATLSVIAEIFSITTGIGQQSNAALGWLNLDQERNSVKVKEVTHGLCHPAFASFLLRGIDR